MNCLVNKARRTKLEYSMQLLRTAQGVVEDVKLEEEDAADNVPEGLQESERYSIMMDAIDSLEEASVNIEEAIDCIDQVIS